MAALDILKSNLKSLIDVNKPEAIEISNILTLNIEELLTEPIKNRKKLIQFLSKFELTMPSIMDNNFVPVQLAKFKKANDENVSSSLIKNLEMIALLFREQEVINDDKREFFHEYFRLSDNELIEKVYNDLDYDIFRMRLYEANELEAKYIFQDLISKIYDIYGLRIFLIESQKAPFNFDGIYFDKPTATAYITTYTKAYSKTLFTILHEMYHFFRDEGNSHTFDIFDDGSVGDTRAEDIRANKFAINFLLYQSQVDIQNFKDNPTKDKLVDIMKKYSVSKQALEIELKIKLDSYKIGNIHSCYFAFDKKTINDLLTSLMAEGSISIRKYNELVSSISK